MEQEVIDKFKINDEAHDLLLSRIKSNRIESGIAVTIIGILVTIIIFISSNILHYSKATFNARIESYDYNHVIDSKLKTLFTSIDSINNKLSYINSNIKTINDRNVIIYNRDSSFYYNEYKPILSKYIMPAYKLSMDNAKKINHMSIVLDSLSSNLSN